MLHAFLGASPQCEASTFIAPSAQVIGDVTLGAHASVWFNATVRGDVHWIRIGEASNIQDNAVVHVTHSTAPTDIGRYVTVGHSAVVHGCTIEDEVLVGMGAIIMDHAVIGAGSLIGARSLVTSGVRIPPGSLVMGTPAKVVRPLTEAERREVAQYAHNYVRYSALYRGAERPAENPYYTPGQPRQVSP